MVSVDYLDEERKKLWRAILDLQEELEKKTSDYEKDARQASKKTSEYRNRSSDAKDEILALLESARQLSGELTDKNREINEQAANVLEASEIAQRYRESIEQLEDKVQAVETLFEEKDGLGEKLSKLEEIAQSGEQSFARINAAYNGLLKRKNELDELYYEIIGYEEEGEGTEEKVRVAGLKDELEEMYASLQSGFASLKEDIANIRQTTLKDYEDDVEKRERDFQGSVTAWKEEYSVLSAEVKKLLPDALTAGLSYAFSEKRRAEIAEGDKASRVFMAAILGLVLVSLIPFAVNVHLVQEGKTIESVIADMPRMVVAIFPLYVPFLWLAYSSNKRANLSKRLVEEYTHKEVLSKTYEGLSRQIESISETEISAELRVKLLWNILDVSSENPGKLISDYNKADHPLIDALEKSSKLGEAVESLSRVPGLRKLAALINKRADEMLARESKKVEGALGTIGGDERQVRSSTIDTAA